MPQLLSPRVTAAEAHLEPVLRKERPTHSEAWGPRLESGTHSATRENPLAAVKTQHCQKMKNIKKVKKKKPGFS